MDEETASYEWRIERLETQVDALKLKVNILGFVLFLVIIL